MKYPYIISENSVTVVVDGRPITVTEGQSNYDSVLRAVKNGDWDSIESRLNIAKEVEDWASGDISIKNGVVYFKGDEELHGSVTKKLLSLIKQGVKDNTPFVNYITNLLSNPSRQSVEELYSFQDYKQLPINEDGHVVAYKSVNEDGWSTTGNKRTKVLQGKTNERGQIYNEIGATIEVERRHVDDDRRKHCSHGLHVGSFNYASTYSKKLLMVTFNPADAVSVPEDCSCQKLRVCKYKVIKEIPNTPSSEVEEPYLTFDTDTQEMIDIREAAHDLTPTREGAALGTVREWKSSIL